jgi:hypothetical protein
MNLLRALPLLLLLASACKEKEKEQTKSSGDTSLCARYADLELKCGGYGEGAREIARTTCEDARGAKKDADMMMKMIALESKCALPDTDCDAYKACVEKAKKDNSPFE